MKILYIAGYNRMVLFNKLIPKALRENGFDVYEFDWNAVYKFNKVIRIFSDKALNDKRNSEVLKKAKSVKPDFVFILKGEPFYNETLYEIKNSTNAVLFNWFGDDPWEFPVFSGKVANYYDYFFTYDPYSVNLYKNIGQKKAFHLPYGYDTEYAASVKITDKDLSRYSCDIAFIASYYPKREELISKIKNKYDLKIWGRGWENSSCKDVFQGHALYGEEMLKAIKCAKIILNIHKGFEEGVEASGNGLNLRVMESAACGAFQITNLQKDIPNRFELNKEIVVFNNWMEAEELFNCFLKDNKQRNKIAEQGYLRASKDHTLKQRMKEIFNIINNVT